MRDVFPPNVIIALELSGLECTVFFNVQALARFYHVDKAYITLVLLESGYTSIRHSCVSDGDRTKCGVIGAQRRLDAIIGTETPPPLSPGEKAARTWRASLGASANVSSYPPGTTSTVRPKPPVKPRLNTTTSHLILMPKHRSLDPVDGVIDLKHPSDLPAATHIFQRDTKHDRQGRPWISMWLQFAMRVPRYAKHLNACYAVVSVKAWTTPTRSSS